MVPEAFIWAGDKLVYECEQPQYGIRGGVDTVLDMYTCQADTASYNTPRGLNTEREDKHEPKTDVTMDSNPLGEDDPSKREENILFFGDFVENVDSRKLCGGSAKMKREYSLEYLIDLTDEFEQRYNRHGVVRDSQVQLSVIDVVKVCWKIFKIDLILCFFSCQETEVVQ